MSTSNVDQLREIGNNAFAQRNFELALTSFTRALELDSTNADGGGNVVLLCSRSATLAQLGKYELALEDANKAIEANPKWAKAWIRKAEAEMGLDQVPAAKQSALNALKLEPLNELGALVLDTINRRLRESGQGQRSVMAQTVSDDFDCALCHCLLYQPVTIACGHSYCKPCLQRAVEHGVEQCPLCRTALHLGLLANLPVNIAFDKLLRLSFPTEYDQRQKEEQAEQQHALHKLQQQNVAIIAGVPATTTFQSPIFYLNVAIWPECTFGMHIFEPRYRALVRDCLQGSRRFVLGPILNHGTLAPVGTLLEIQTHQSLPDGRSLIQTRAVCRVRLVSTQRGDGPAAYDVATCLLYSDDENEVVDAAELNQMAQQIRQRLLELEQQSVPVRRLLAQCSPAPIAQWNVIQASWIPHCLFVQLPLSAQLDRLQDRSVKDRLQTLLHLLEQI